MRFILGEQEEKWKTDLSVELKVYVTTSFTTVISKLLKDNFNIHIHKYICNTGTLDMHMQNLKFWNLSILMLKNWKQRLIFKFNLTFNLSRS